MSAANDAGAGGIDRDALDAFWRELGLTPSDLAQKIIFTETRDLVPIGRDCSERDAFLAPLAAPAWRSMHAASKADGMKLLVVSAYRTYEYQARLFARKLREGITPAEAMRVVLPPGCSQHHTGRAVDVAAPGFEALVETFDTTPEFRWLEENAHRFGFVMPYPRDNPQGITYEPWHWFFAPPGTIA